jgi:hypothetical protein
MKCHELADKGLKASCTLSGASGQSCRPSRGKAKVVGTGWDSCQRQRAVSRVTLAAGMGSGFQPAMVRAWARA